MRENDLKAHQKRRFKKTTDSEHKGRIAANLLAQDFSATAPDQKWAADISYIWTAEELKVSTRDGKEWLVLNRTKDELKMAPAYNNTGSPREYRGKGDIR